MSQSAESKSSGAAALEACKPSQKSNRGFAQRLRVQFARPTGFWGRVAGMIMAGRASNLERIDWVIATLEIEPADRVLEIGFGPGVSIKRISMLAPDGLVVGIDHSDLMVERARRRNAAAIANKTVDVLSGSVSNLPRFDQPFDKILAINSMMFWDEPIERLKDLRFLLKPGGRIAIGMQPRSKGATDQIAIVIGHELVKQLTAAGFKDVRLETRRMKPVATVCALGFRRN